MKNYIFVHKVYGEGEFIGFIPGQLILKFKNGKQLFVNIDDVEMYKKDPLELIKKISKSRKEIYVDDM